MEVLSLLLFLGFFASGVWMENAFQMDTATVVLFVLVTFLIDRALTALSLDGDSTMPWLWDGLMSNLTACDRAADLSSTVSGGGGGGGNSSSSTVVVEADYCCTASSVATQCAAYTQHRLGAVPIPIVPALAFVCLVAFIILEVTARRTFGWRYVKTSSYDLDERRRVMRNVQYRVLTSIDLFLSLIWHSFLLWWTVQAVRLGWQPTWVVLSVFTVALSLATTAIALCVSRRFHYRTAILGVLFGVAHFALSVTALVVVSAGIGQAVLPKPDVRFAMMIGIAALVLRTALLLYSAVYIRHAKAHRSRERTRRCEQRKGRLFGGDACGAGAAGVVDAAGAAGAAGAGERGARGARAQAVPLLELPAHLESAVSESEARAIRHMATGTRLLLSTRGQRPKPAFLQLSTRGEVLRWSWRGRAVLVHEIQSLHASRHPDYRTPCITLIMNGYGVPDGQRALDLVMNEASEYRLWMTGLQAMVRAVHHQRHGFSPEFVAFVLACFRAADARSNGLLDEKELLDCFTRLNLSKPIEWAKEVRGLAHVPAAPS